MRKKAAVKRQNADVSWPRVIPRAFAFILGCVLAAAAGAQPASTGSGQAYPTRPIRLIVPFPPGGSNDIVGRLMGTHMTERLGKSVVVDNRGGAGGTIGTEAAIRSRTIRSMRSAPSR
jgi:tripartite-type tricarboxylate transporter receptor subunit TctC